MEIWIGRDGQRHGPYKEDDVRQWLRSGQMAGDDLGWYEGLADWQPLSVLFPDALAATPPAIPPVATVPPPTTTAALEDYAGFWRRVGAWVIDYLILLLPMGAILVSTGAATAFEHMIAQVQGGAAPAAAALEYTRAVRPASIYIMLVGFLYYAVCEGSRWQATLGKLAMGMRVTDLDGRPLGFARSIVRNLVRLANIVTWLIPLICYLAVAWTQRKQGFHDMLARALVLNGRASAFQDKPHTDDRSFHA